MRRALWAAALLLAGCGGPHDEPLPYPMVLSPEALGPIRPGSPFEYASFQGKLPGFTVERLSQVTPASSETLFSLKRGNTVLAYIFPDEAGEKITRITVVSKLIPDHSGQNVGNPIRERGDLRCEREECRYSSVPELRYRIVTSSRIIREITLQKL